MSFADWSSVTCSQLFLLSVQRMAQLLTRVLLYINCSYFGNGTGLVSAGSCSSYHAMSHVPNGWHTMSTYVLSAVPPLHLTSSHLRAGCTLQSRTVCDGWAHVAAMHSHSSCELALWHRVPIWLRLSRISTAHVHQQSDDQLTHRSRQLPCSRCGQHPLDTLFNCIVFP